MPKSSGNDRPDDGAELDHGTSSNEYGANGPLAADIVAEPREYQWWSCRAYALGDPDNIRYERCAIPSPIETYGMKTHKQKKLRLN